ncbi:MAG TPA: hypothetical protein VFZ76_12805, partial [Anaerolineales bacterium]
MQSKSFKAIICLALLIAITGGAYFAHAQEKAPETTPDRLVRISAATEQRFPAGVDPSGPANVSSVAVTTDMSEGFESSW